MWQNNIKVIQKFDTLTLFEWDCYALIYERPLDLAEDPELQILLLNLKICLA